MTSAVVAPYVFYTDRKGVPLDEGYVYVGVANQDPQSFPQACFWDEALTIPAAQPLRTVAGYVVNPNAGNSPGEVFTADTYSIRIRDKQGVQVFYKAEETNPLAEFIVEVHAFIASLAAAGGSGLVGFSHAQTYPTGTIGIHAKSRVSVKDAPFNAVGDGSVDDTPAIAAAYNYARANGIGEVHFPAGDYYISATINAADVATFGDGFETTRIYATVAMDSMIDLADQNSRLANIFIDGNQVGGRLAKHGIRLAATNSTQITNVRVAATNRDGIYFQQSGNNNNVTIKNCLVRNIGTIYSTGTATNAAGGTTATMTGAGDLTTLGIRVGYDYIKVNNEAIRLITGVTANTISFFPSIASAYAGTTYSIRMGSCVGIPAHGDNSVIKIENSVLQDAAVAGVQDQGLYGAICNGNVIEGCEAGRIIGKRFPGNDTRNIGAYDAGCYYETSPSGHYILEFWKALEIANPVFGDAGLVDWFDKIRIVDSTDSTSRFTVDGKEPFGRKVTATNSVTLNPAFGETFIIRQSAGATNIDVNLPAVVTTSNSGVIYQNYSIPITFMLNDIGGKTITFKAGVNVNGVAGATGAAFTGNYRRLVCVYDGSNGWTVA